MSRLALFSAALLSACAAATPDAEPIPEAGTAGATVSAFQDGVAPIASYAGTRDTMIEEAHPSTGHGSDPRLSISGDTPSDSGDDESVLLRWDLGSTIPAGATVTAAAVVLQVTDKADQTYEMFEATQAWDEITATWKRASSSLDWDSNGADGAGDRGTAVVGTIRAASTGTYRVALTAAGIAMVQRWVADPSTNHGVVIADAGNDNRLEITSREGSKSSRPRLEITWQVSTGPVASTYAQTCDGSAGIALDATHFVNFSDEDQVLRIYARGGGTQAPVQTIDISGGLGMSADDEADLEDAARIGNRIYAITSHGRDKHGDLQNTRYRFAAIDVSGAVPTVQLTVAGYSDHLLTDLLDAANWDHPDTAILGQLAAATELSQASVADLAPEVHGLNIEGLARDPSATNPDRLILGLRNPQAGSAALLITLLNPDDVVAGQTAHFGEVVELALGGRGVRGLTWADALNQMVVIGGPIADAGTVELYTWSGDPVSAPIAVQALTGAALTAAEAVVAYPGSRDLQVLFDDGGESVSGTACKKLSVSQQRFVDQIVRL